MLIVYSVNNHCIITLQYTYIGNNNQQAIVRNKGVYCHLTVFKRYNMWIIIHNIFI